MGLGPETSRISEIVIVNYIMGNSGYFVTFDTNNKSSKHDTFRNNSCNFI